MLTINLLLFILLSLFRGEFFACFFLCQFHFFCHYFLFNELKDVIGLRVTIWITHIIYCTLKKYKRLVKRKINDAQKYSNASIEVISAGVTKLHTSISSGDLTLGRSLLSNLLYVFLTWFVVVCFLLRNDINECLALLCNRNDLLFMYIWVILECVLKTQSYRDERRHS
jgi:hypothetical protein